MDMYVVKTLALTTVILVVIYIFIFRRNRKAREKTWDSVAEYHERYLDRRRQSDGHDNYVTRFNSTEDYREKAVDTGEVKDMALNGVDDEETAPIDEDEIELARIDENIKKMRTEKNDTYVRKKTVL